MQWLETLSRRLSLWGAYLSSLLLIALVGLILVEIVGRSFFDTSTMIADEYSGYLYLATVFFGLAFTFREKGHIRINIVTARLGEKGRRNMDVFAGVLSVGVMVFVLYYCWAFMIDAHEMEMVSENVSETPLYLTQIPMPVGVGVFLFALVVFTLKKAFYDR